MGNTNNSGRTGASQAALDKIGTEIRQAFDAFNQGQSGNLSRGITRNAGETGSSQQQSSQGSYGQAEQPVTAPATTHRIEASDTRADRDQEDSRTATTMSAVAQPAEETASPTRLNGSVQNERTNTTQVNPIIVDSSTGHVVQTNSAANQIAEESISDSSIAPRRGWRQAGTNSGGTAQADNTQPIQGAVPVTNAVQETTRRTTTPNRRITGYTTSLPQVEQRRNETPYQAAERVMNTYEQSRQDEAGQQDRDAYAGYVEFRQNNPLADPSEYIARQRLSEESFRNMAVLPGDRVDNDIDDFERMLDETGLRDAPDESANVQAEKDTSRQDRIINTTVRDIVRGFFHVEGERVVQDKNGVERLRWDEDVEAAIIDLMKYFNIRGIRGQRTVFRLVRLYASMSIDRHGRMFNQEQDEWSLSSNEFVMICRLIKQSCIENGHPLGIVNRNAELRDTPIFPCGVMPRAVASVICNPGSNLNCTPAELVQMCQDEWTTNTLPDMRRTLSGEATGQLVVIYDMARSISMLDGLSAERFSERYNVSTTLDYHLSEYQDRNRQYAIAMHNSVDALAIEQRENAKTEQYRNRFDRQRHFSMVRDHEGIEHPIQTREKDWVSGLKFVNKLARAGSILLNVPVNMGAFLEKGVGNFRTNLALYAMGSSYRVSDYTNERVRSDESVEAFQCVKELYDAFGPGAVRLFAESGMEYTKENVAQFARDNLDTLTSRPAEMANRMLDRLTHNLLTADYAFRRSDVDLWFKAYLASNKAAADVQQKLADRGELSQREIPLTASEIDGMVRSYTSMGQFFSEAMGSDYGINAYNMMKANNIGQVSPWSYSVDRFLRDHTVTDTVITQFVDTYPRYGMNFIYMITPFSRTISYINYKMYERDTDIAEGDRDLTRADVVIGGNYEDFLTGLRMNLIYDAFTFAHSFLIGGLFGVIMYMLGFDYPDDEGNKYNASMWKIGGNIGLGEDTDGDGKGDGVEIQVAWWMNDLMLLQMPIAYLTAGYLKTGDPGLAKDLMISGLHDTIDGNVLLDFANTVNNFREDYVEFNKMIEDDSYNGPKDLYSYATLEFQQYTLSLLTGKKWNPLNPLVNMINRDTMFAGEEARNRAYNKVFDKSDEWHIKNGITKGVGYDEYLRRKYTSSNLFYAALCNQFINHGDESKTGYFWWEMPARTMGDNLAYAYCSKYQMDYSKKPEWQSTEEFEEEMANMVIADIESFDGDINKALMQGYTIPKDARKATLNVLFSRRNSLDNEWAARLESGELANYVDREPKYVRYKEERDKINTMIFDWLKNEDIPMWSESYEQLLTDYEIGYVWKDSGNPPKPAPETEMFNPNVEAVFIPKGNHPTSFAPFTVVDTRDRGWNAETINYWVKQGESGTDFDAIFEGIGKTELKFGRDAGMILNDSLFGKQPISEDYAHRDLSTINYRSYVPKELTLDDEIRNFDETAANGGVLGENGKYSQDAQDIINGKAGSGNGSGYTTYWPRSTYGYSSGGNYTGNYNPKIYSTPRQVNADRAATMYTKSPTTSRTTYLRPSYSTKGSRESYKRQDI